jgi:hypothetical protein
MSKNYIGMASFSLIVAIISVLGLSYIFIAKPDYLKADRDGVPYYTPQVVHPETGEPVSLGELIRHFKGE